VSLPFRNFNTSQAHLAAIQNAVSEVAQGVSPRRDGIRNWIRDKDIGLHRFQEGAKGSGRGIVKIKSDEDGNAVDADRAQPLRHPSELGGAKKKGGFAAGVPDENCGPVADIQDKDAKGRRHNGRIDPDKREDSQ
jgi:hypothetical protein